MVPSRAILGGTAPARAGTDGADRAARTPVRRLRHAAARGATHLAAWFPFGYAAVRAMAAGWRPIGDNAAIALRSWDVLSAHAPLAGQATRLGSGVYDPGPLQYWLLTVPVHLDPQRGVLWGSALWCMLACSLAIEAARAVAGRAGSLLACGMILGTLAWLPGIAGQPCWNPWFGMTFFLAALAAAWAVMCGRRGWLPVLVVCASVAAQAHLVFTIAAGAVVLLAFGVGLAGIVRARPGYRWAGAALAAALVCWSAPLVQQLTGPHGNLAALVTKRGGSGAATAGLHFGLQALAAATQPPPFWWRPVSSLMRLSLIGHRSAWAGLAALILVTAAGAAALVWLRSRWLAALASITLVTSLAAMVTYSAVPAASVTMAASSIDNLGYLVTPMIVIGLLTWLTAGSALVLAARKAGAGEAVTRAAGRLPGVAAGKLRGVAAGKLAGVAAGAAAGALLAASVTVSLTAVRHTQPPRNPLVATLNAVTSMIERKVSAQPVSLAIAGTDNHIRRRLVFALVYQLRIAGYRAEVAREWAIQLGPGYEARGRRLPLVTIYHRGRGELSVYQGSGDRLSVRVTRPGPR
jgi:hypothetical protein